MFRDKKVMITNIAQKVFSKYGLVKTTVNEIAKAARIGKATIYHYFNNKEDIYKEVVEKENRILNQKIAEAIEREKMPEDKLRAYIMTRMKYLKELINIHTTLTEDYLDNYAFIEKIRERNDRKEIEVIKSILIDGNDRKLFFVDDIELTAFTIITALKGFEYPWSTNISLPEIQENIDKLLYIVFHGINKKKE